MPGSFLIHTFGCKSNQYESQGMREALSAAGFSAVERVADADIFLVNTCSVTSRASASCRNAIRKAIRVNPCIRLVVIGCGVDLGELWPESSFAPPLLIKNAGKHALPGLLKNWLSGMPTGPEPIDNHFGLSISAFHNHTRAFLKIQDGCDAQCSYCIVPRVRGKPKSRSTAEVLAEAGRLVANGHGELVLTGINIGAWRQGGLEFPDLVERLTGTPGLVRLRLGSIEPPYMNERLARVMRDSKNVCPHVHLPFQSGDDRILAAMGRRYSAAEVIEKADMLKTLLHHPAISTDVIVGFPGEDAAALYNSFEACRKAGFSRLHVFLFSPRPGTPAASLRRALPDRIVAKGKAKLISLGKELAETYAAACIGMEERVIVEKPGSGLSERYLRVRLSKGAGPAGSVVRTRIVGAVGASLMGAGL